MHATRRAGPRACAVAAIARVGTVGLVAATSVAALARTPSASAVRPGAHRSARPEATATAARPGAAPIASGRLAGYGAAVDASDADFQLTKAQARLARSLGAQGVLQVDPTTGTPRVVERLDGYLTGRSARPPADIALDYVAAHRAVFGLRPADLAALRLVREYVDIQGTDHLLWQQRYRGVPVFDHDLRANVAPNGRLISILGAPVSGVVAQTTTPTLTAAAAVGIAGAGTAESPRSVARPRSQTSGPARTTSFGGGDSASLVLFPAARRERLGWQTIVRASPAATFASVVDARSGRVVWRANLTRSDVAGTGLAWRYAPGTSVPAGGDQTPVDFPVVGPARLSGDNAHVYSDVHDDGRPEATDEIPASGGTDWSYPAALATSRPSQHCTAAYPCSWNSAVARSWRTNLRQDATQVYFFLNAFHDHLEAPPIGFTEAAGNFQRTNSTPSGKGDDAVQGQIDDGASTDHGLPDRSHRANANMYTPPDGSRPIMQMYLFPGGRRFPSANGGDDASVVYHEYTHGLSGRLITNAKGVEALNSWQSASLGEAWSDWYALDYLVAQGDEHDTAAAGDVVVGRYVTRGDGIRSEPLDCPVGTAVPACPGGRSTGRGGYTYGDYGRIAGHPEVHADGEIWAQTLWQIRSDLGSVIAERLVTRAMELSPPDPSFLDMRNAILEADTVDRGGADASTLWADFASRGMGYFAFAADGDDVRPHEDFSMPPDCATSCFKVSGTVTEASSGAPLGGVRVAVGGFDTAFSGDLADVTDAAGHYSIPHVPQHVYPQLRFALPGYEPAVAPDLAVASDRVVDRAMFFDWAAAANGAGVQSADGPDFTRFGCGPRGAIDGSLATGWGTTTGRPRAIVIRLPRAVNVSAFAVDPGPVCGDRDGAALRYFEILTRTRRGHWIVAYDRKKALPIDRLSVVRPRRGRRHVRVLKLVMRSNRGDRRFVDMTELSVRGARD